MGRIDEALKQAQHEAPVQPAREGSEVFHDPWDFSAAPAPLGERDRDPETAVIPDHGAASETPTTVQFRHRRLKPEVAERLITAPNAPSQLVEQYRRLAATVHHAQQINGIRILLVTSALPGDGKTLTSTNLALTLSESYRRQVLLIDADLRRPSLHSNFQVPNIAGLNEGLKADRDAKLPTAKITDNLTLLPAGKPDPDPMGGLTSDRMRMILEEAARRFDWVVVDTAPVGLLVDASILASMADATIMVIRAGKTAAPAVAKALETVGRERVLGVVLNGVDDLKEGGYYGYSRHASKPDLQLVGNP
jgi:capsular exopolysaccharide synthesis family protein